MALRKIIVLDNGLTGNYHKVDTFIVKDASIRVIMHLYKDTNARKNGLKPILDKSYMFEAIVPSGVNTNIYKYVYTLLKSLDYFEGSTDI